MNRGMRGRRAGFPRTALTSALVVALLAAIGLTGCGTGSDAVATGGEFQFVAPGGQTTIYYDPPAERAPLPALSGESLTEAGKPVGIRDFPGQVVVINLWASWCGPCRAEMADLQVLQDQLRGDGVAVLGLNIRDSRSAAADLALAIQVSYPSIFDPAGRTLLSLHGYPRNVIPSTIVLDRQHRVAAIYLTRIRPAELSDVLRRLADEPTA